MNTNGVIIMDKSNASTVDWCFSMRDEAYANGNVEEAENYQKLAQDWQAKERATVGERGVTRSCSD